MSRHQYVKRLDAQDVLDEFEGGYDNEEIEENGAEGVLAQKDWHYGPASTLLYRP